MQIKLILTNKTQMVYNSLNFSCHDIAEILLTLVLSTNQLINLSIFLIDLLIDWCLTLTLAVFQPYRGVNKCYLILRHLQDP